MHRNTTRETEPRKRTGPLTGRLGRWLADDRGGVATIAGVAALTIAVLAAAGVVASVMMDHANAIPAPGAVAVEQN